MPSTDDRASLRRALEISLRLGLVTLLAVWCFLIASPFLQPIAWGVILAVASQPLYEKLSRSLQGRRALAAGLMVAVALAVVVVPAALLTVNLAESAAELAEKVEAGTLEVPPPPAGVAEWPVVGERVHAFWSAASNNLDAALDPLHPQLKTAGRWLLAKSAAAGIGLLVFALSIVLAGVLLASSGPAADAARRVAERVVPGGGAELVELSRNTIQSVTQGILGTAAIQAMLAGLGLFLAGVPAFGLWTVLVLLLAVVQLPTLLVLAPIMAWVFGSSSTGVAVLFAVWSTAVGLSDNVLKPLLLGRGSSVPTAIIFIGAIGGFVRSGIIGLFVGAVVLAVGHALFQWWLASASDAEPG